MPQRNDVQAMSGAARAKAFRLRKRKGLVSIRFELRAAELDAMVRHGLLPAERRNDAAAIFVALGKLLDRAVDALEAGALPEILE